MGIISIIEYHAKGFPTFHKKISGHIQTTVFSSNVVSSFILYPNQLIPSQYSCYSVTILCYTFLNSTNILCYTLAMELRQFYMLFVPFTLYLKWMPYNLKQNCMWQMYFIQKRFRHHPILRCLLCSHNVSFFLNFHITLFQFKYMHI